MNKERKQYNIDDYKSYEEIYNKKSIFQSLAKTIFIMILSTLVALLFKKLGLSESNIILVLTVSVLFVSSCTNLYIYSALASIIAVLCFNFFFTQPYYTFLVNDSGYIITFCIMLIATLITSNLNSSIKKEARTSFIKEQTIKLLYINNKKLLKAKSKRDIIKHCKDSLVDIFNRDIVIAINDEILNTIEYSHYSSDIMEIIFKSKLEKDTLKKCFLLEKPVGITTQIDNDRKIYYHPIKGKKSTIGVIGIGSYDKDPISENEKIILESISTQVALAIEKEALYEQNKKINIETQRERIRGNLLRSISHDLRTPLASILGSTSTIIHNYEKVNDNVKKELLNNIYEDASWLTHSVENILSMTRMDEGKFEIKKNIEVAEEIVVDAVKRITQFTSNGNIKIELPEEIIVVYVEGLLIKQVLVNLLDNAIKHTKVNSKIQIRISKDEDNVVFKVIDSGEGIKEEDIKNIFDRFYTKGDNKNLEKRGIGLGLAICKSIVVAHGGEIKAYNNLYGGATFEFSIPNREERNIYGVKTTNINS